ncbi:hypothetical protein F2P56_007399 [Juglans regia]|uniref:Uncharacterized protein LOC109019172 n=2 Tax=Juglans regia TaxID=51240 RepID=A0A2I4HLB5_JUGRE|nr:uncharacterized protein LOC109019172 [Juglans regia]KAF5475607.1 hypothetical protein F2P56_007399 [Juglans regia]
MAWILAPKALLVSTGVALVGLALRLSMPLALEFSASHLPLIWASLLSWLKPPYLFFIINGIIIGIAVTSRFHHNHHHDGSERQVPDDDPPPRRTPTEEISSELSVYHYSTDATHQLKREEATYEVSEVTKAVVVMNGYAESEAEAEAEEDDDDNDEALGWKSTGNQTKRLYPSETQLTEYFSPAEKPLVSVRFGHRKPVKASPEGGSGRTLRVAKPKRHETMENTWKAITEGRTMPLSRHMRKCDTWENHGHRQIDFPEDPSPVKKSETFKDRTNLQQTPSPGSSNSKLRKEPSLSQDELNRRVEAFINKFNEEMRLQRQESLNQYMEMINRGAH